MASARPPRAGLHFAAPRLAICGLAADELLAQEVKEDIEALGRRVLTITADVSDPRETQRYVQQRRCAAASGE